ncbi:serine protease 55 [Pipistrellus kuhlii]|uniref:Serine protease 55 n=2 Tax=Pipistrellus kuhlii TaxID=59472 RepID=A0A7J7XC67_PIPKU|nr:serine protease 55 [Pipistrellus kuhlii]KAF6347232.1 serine protease 55 [Pipistrellus kuhlii]
MLLLSVLLLMSQARGAHLACGKRPTYEEEFQHSRIIGGMEAEEGEFPWMVSIQAGNQHFCGGTIINNWWIVTAAHCLSNDELNPMDLSIVLGTNDLQSPFLEVKGVTSIVIHKNFERSTMDNDIALLLLNTEIKFSGLKEPICMPRQPGPTKWNKCWVAGWGQTKPDDKNSESSDLKKVPIVIMDWRECTKVFPKLTKNMLCAGYANKSYDSCQGDSGGPLVCTTESDRKWYQVGIISWGRSCGQKNIPGIYTLLYNYGPWIKKVTEVEGRSYDPEKVRTEEVRAPPPETQMRSKASEFPEPSGPRLWLLLCLLSYILF